MASFDAVVYTILLSNTPPRPVDAVYFFGRSYFDAGKEDIFQLVADLVKNNFAKYLLLADSEGERHLETIPRVAYPGKSLWIDRLVRLGVNKDRIILCPHPTPGERGFNTKTEAGAFVNASATRDLRTAVVVTQPHQLVRATLSTIKPIIQCGLPIDVWSMAPKITDWNYRVMGSQGMVRKPRLYHIREETDRVITYQDSGDIASFDELFAYLKQRDSRQKL